MNRLWDKNLSAKKNIEKIDLPFKPYVFIGLITNLFAILIILVFKRLLPPEIPIFYGLAEGEEQLAPSWTLILPSLISTTVLFINIALSFLTKDLFLKKSLILIGIISIFFTLFTSVRIAMIVGSFI